MVSEDGSCPRQLPGGSGLVFTHLVFLFIWRTLAEWVFPRAILPSVGEGEEPQFRVIEDLLRQAKLSFSIINHRQNSFSELIGLTESCLDPWICRIYCFDGLSYGVGGYGDDWLPIG